MIEWFPLRWKDSIPNSGRKILMYRENFGVFFGYYGSLKDVLSYHEISEMRHNGVDDYIIERDNFYIYDMSGNRILESDELPEFWAYVPKFLNRSFS